MACKVDQMFELIDETKPKIIGIIYMSYMPIVSEKFKSIIVSSCARLNYARLIQLCQ
jgi:hypothetical protein